MYKYTVVFNDISTLDQLYDSLISGLCLPEWCGKNPDAIWDMLTGYVDDPAVIDIRGINLIPDDLKNEVEVIKNVFDRLSKHPEYGSFDICYTDNDNSFIEL